MKAIILAAGRGERMRPLTDHCPKPLLHVRGKPLIQWHIEALVAAGVRDIVINCAWLEEQFPATLGDGSRFGVRLHYQFEQALYGGALETAGGIATALPTLCAEGEEAFWVISADVYLPAYVLDHAQAQRFAASPLQAHLWLIDNPKHKPGGDFAIEGGLASYGTGPRYTWSCIGLFKRSFFAAARPGHHAALRPLLDAGIARSSVGASHLDWPWSDVGTPERLAQANAMAA